MWGAASCTSAELRVPNNMTNDQKLRKANNEFRDEVAKPKTKIEVVLQDCKFIERSGNDN